jgi:hypothetical protein
MSNSTDLRRAKALLEATCLHYGDPIPTNPDLSLTLVLVRAIRASDEAAGMVLVPRVATLAMLNAGRKKMFGPDVGPTSEVWNVMLAAHGGEDG